MAVTRRKQGMYGYVELTNPPVNAINRDMRQGLLDAVKWAEDEGLERVILSGAGRAFAAGADAKEFDGPPLEPHLPDVLNAIETSHVHWVAAIHGPALGGGAEIVLACRYRVAHPKALIGFPEVTLGVVPGAGGTQRLPRLVGMEQALALIPTGKPVSGVAAKQIGLVHEVDEDPVAFAEMTNSEWLGMAVPVGELNTGEAAPELFAAARATADQKMRGQIAPQRAIDLLELSMTADLAAGMAEERAAFLELRTQDQARALRHAFFAERGAKAPDWLTATPKDVASVAVVGGGTMGAAIAYAMLNAGLSVVLLETDADGVARARDNVEKIVAASLKRGLISEEGAADRRARLTLSHDYSDAGQVDLAIEAAFESMDVKKQIFAKLEAAVQAGAVLATNTSYLDVNEIASALQAPSRLVGLHFFAPAHIMKLLEIVRGDATSDEALATGFALAKTLRKIPVLAGVCDGFIGNRILARYREAADTVFMDGSTPWEVDEAMVEFGYAMGPYEAQDLSGLDIAHANRRRQDATRDPNRRYIPIADRMVELGKLGRKTGAGWYRYPGGNGKVEDPIVADLAIEEAHFAKITRTDYSADQIRHRLLLAMINEAAAILGEGIAQSAADIDLVTMSGYGFPRWRGGLMHYADTLGAKEVLAGLEALCAEDPLVWAPSQVVKDCAAKDIRFADWTPA
ncbi:3-hydroxyacyl-CoA dehydrogenase NAD-binding domain-containing protein [Pseudoprimorskyibacter insulae]|uniref:Fatty acid oxidation complex subunit alpha n=1 Tax=Pseudoprimorskyibacter insulae TaxID=1695997 RepID=A0A2R8B0I2_9RHOB|nr:3-hydroxyacyl-CoA dehydrogenase NAD-binding domain-containing protein [Pseudoprimorskyibacter insulae]SPF81619.1 Fatty acid oxidation complex subunit alpha [Pseudoprimorskyibacter insulae]